jgi:RNA polymerase sigma-70 factor (ECF subfamily)
VAAAAALAIAYGVNNNTLGQEADPELLRRIGAGDRAAFLRLYDRYSALLFSIATRVLGDRKEAEDVLQEVFLQIWRRADDYDPGLGTAASWVAAMARNKAIDRLRARVRRSQLAEEIALEVSPFADQPDTAANEFLYGRERAQAIRAAVDGLPQEQRLAIELAFFSGLSQSEVAARLQQPLGTIKARIRRGMLKLREQLGGAS